VTTAPASIPVDAAGSPPPVPSVFLGSGPFALPILSQLAGDPAVDLVGVVTAPPRPVGRRQVETPTPIDSHARALGLRVLTSARLRDPASLSAVLDLAPDLVILADYGQLVPSALLDRRHGALNLHPSLLPRHRGASPIPAAILAGDRETGVTLMQMDVGLDTGPIVAAEGAVLSGEETAPALEARLAIVAAGILARSLGPWLAGELVPTPQPDEGATLTRPLRRSDGRLDASLPAAILERHVRAYLPWPGSFLETDRDRLAVLAATIGPADREEEPGRLVADPAGLALTTGNGRLLLDEVQPAGGQPMSGAEYVRGHPRILGRSVHQPPGFGDGPLPPGGEADPRPASLRAGSGQPSGPA
jgi:methionyl-tRNA formyltransferase